jgi:N-acetylneuraminate synthase
VIWQKDRSYVIAEIGINHNGDLDTAKKLISAAAAAKCDAVKFQKRDIDRVYTRAELERHRPSPFGETNGDLKRGLEFGIEELGDLFDHARNEGVDCSASVWDEASVELVAAFAPPFIKIPSPLVRHRGLLDACRRSGIDVVMSTGGATLEEIRDAVSRLGDVAALMHCVSAYPCPDDQVNLRQMMTLRETFGGRVGYSSHELGPYAVWAAVALGAEVLERHITLDRGMWGSDQSMSTEPDELAALVAGVRTIEACLGCADVVQLSIEEAAIAKLGRVGDYKPVLIEEASDNA